MLPKQNRLVKTKEIDLVWQKGRSNFDNVLGVKVFPSAKNINRFAVVVSTKVSKKATKRNTIKRQLSEAIRLNINSLKPGFDFFILSLPKSIDKNYHELEASLLGHFKKLQVVKEVKHYQNLK